MLKLEKHLSRPASKHRIVQQTRDVSGTSWTQEHTCWQYALVELTYSDRIVCYILHPILVSIRIQLHLRGKYISKKDTRG